MQIHTQGIHGGDGSIEPVVQTVHPVSWSCDTRASEVVRVCLSPSLQQGSLGTAESSHFGHSHGEERLYCAGGVGEGGAEEDLLECDAV